MKLTAAEYSRGLLTWQPTDGLSICIGTAASRDEEIHWSDPVTNPHGSLIGIDLGAIITFRLQGFDRLDQAFWIKLECIQRNVVYARIWHGIPNEQPVILSHVPDYGKYHRLVVDAGSLGWDTDVVFRDQGVLVRFVTGNVEGEVTDELKPVNSPDGKITMQGGQKTAIANGRFIEVVTPGKSSEQAELHAHALLGLMALALGQNVLGRIVFSEPWVTTPEEQLGEAIALGSEGPRQAEASEFDGIDALIARLTQEGQIERARVISLRWYERGFRAREPLDMLLSFYIGVESLVAAFSKASAPLPVEAAREGENQAILKAVSSLGKAVKARVSQRIRGPSIREQFEHYATNHGLAESDVATFKQNQEAPRRRSPW